MTLNEDFPTNSIGLSSTVHGTGNIDRLDPPSLFKTRKHKRKLLKGFRQVTNEAITRKTRFATRNTIKLGGVTPLLINPTMRQAQNRIGDTDKDYGNTRNSSSVVKENLGVVVGAAVGAYIGSKIRKRLGLGPKPQAKQPRNTRATIPSRYNPTTGPWGARVQNPANVTGPKVQQGSTEFTQLQPKSRSGRAAGAPSSSSPPPNSNTQRLSSADYRNLIAKNPALKVSAGKKN